MNVTVAQLTVSAVLGRRRAVLLLLLSVVLLGLCLFARVFASADPDVAGALEQGLAADLLGGFGLAVLLPLLGVIVGTGVIGPEIDDGSILYLLSKPLSRLSIVVTKLLVAVGVVAAFGAAPVVLGGVILTGQLGEVALAYGLGSFVAGFSYCALFLLLAVITRNAVVVGLLYALIWESLVGQIVPGAQAMSIQQWALALTEQTLGDDAARLGVASAVDVGTAAALLLLVVLASTWYAARRLRTIRLSDEA
jgi:ABC-2 type transport system permease protein